MLFPFLLPGVVMIRCDIHKGKLRLGNFIEPGRDAQPRKDEGFVIDHGNIGTYSIINRVIQPERFSTESAKTKLSYKY